VDDAGIESAASNREKVYVRNSQAGDNLIINGKFTQGDSFWTHQNQRDASSSGSITDSMYRFQISGAGLVPSDVQLIQDDVPLIHGKEYVLELDARADAPRTIGIELERDDVSWESYSRHGVTYIGTEFTHIEHTFRMDHPNDLKARFVIYGGGSDIDFEVSNISLRQKVQTGTPAQHYSGTSISCFPNPADTELHVLFKLEYPSAIQLQLFTLAGRPVKTVHLPTQSAGPVDLLLNTSKLGDAAYIMQVQSEYFKKATLVQVQH
jgi:hypothetical protein